MDYKPGRINEKGFLASLKFRFLSYLAFFFIYLLHKTLRYEIVGEDKLKNYQDKNKSVLVGIWHQNTILSVCSLVPYGVSLLVSSSTDGEMIAFVAYLLGLKSFRGSSSREGVRALLSCKRFLDQGGSLAIAVDGPRGPAFEPKPGIVFLAEKTKTPVLGMLCKSSRFWTLSKTWDQFRVPKPFSKVKIYFSDSLSTNVSEVELKASLNALENLSVS